MRDADEGDDNDDDKQKTRSNETVHTSAKPCLTSLAISCAGDTSRYVHRSRCRAIVGP